MRIAFIPFYHVFVKDLDGKNGQWMIVKHLTTAKLLHKPYNPNYKPQTILVECAIMDGQVIIPNTVNQL